MCFVRLNKCGLFNIVTDLKNIFYPKYINDALW